MKSIHIIGLLFLILLPQHLLGQEIFVHSFLPSFFDLSAKTHPQYDRNGNECALLKVAFAEKDADFVGNVIQPVKRLSGIYWVYMPKGSYRLKVLHDDFLPVDIDFLSYPDVGRLESGVTYNMVLKTRRDPADSVKGNFLILYITPIHASVKVDGKVMTLNEKGMGKTFLPKGTHRYSITANGYSPVEEEVVISSERIMRTVNLTSNRPSLTVATTTSGTEIFINEERKGTDNWTGNVDEGTCLVEGRKDGCKTHKMTIDITGRNNTVTIPALIQSTGSLLIDYEPVDADIYLDNRLLGKSPNVFSNILTGKHSIKISKAGYNDHTETITIPEGQQTSLTGSLSQGIASSGDILPIEVKGISFNMVRVEGGTFDMGATPEQVNPNDDEKPVHQVTLSSYYIGETEVTQALWQAVMGSNPSDFKGDSLPVEYVSWDDCQTFIERLNTITHRNFRLPTEAEWEFAARGGNKSRHTQYSGSDNLDEVAWYGSNSNDKTHPVKSKKANELGIYDMSGNVWEWCQDKYDSTPQNNPIGPSSGARRVSRGGGWGSDARGCRLSCRSGRSPGFRTTFLGLRLVLSE